MAVARDDRVSAARALASLLYRFHKVYFRGMNLPAWIHARLYEPRLSEAYRFVADSAGTKRHHQPGRGWFILRLLERHRPRHVIELGSGQSTAAFAAYAKRHGATLVSFEQSLKWQELSNSAARMVGGDEPVVISEVKVVEGFGGRYRKDIPDATDFVYVDGPAIHMKADHPAGKAAYTDVYDALSRGADIKVIVIDGRTDTVDYLLGHPRISEYVFYPEFIYAHRKGHWLQALRFRRQSVFVKR